MTKKKQTAIRFTEEGERVLNELSEKMGISKSAIMEIAVRRMGEQEGIEKKREVKEEA